jgi:Flp pilus assembly protein TadG
MNPICHLEGQPLRGVRRLLRQRGGMAAVEFGLILPFMVAMYLGAFEIMEGILVKRQVTLTASTVTNIVSQYASISQSTEMPDILNASISTMMPFSDTNAVVTVSLVSINAAGQATVTWSQSLHGTARTVGQTVTLPSGINTPSTSVVWGETTYSYKPAIDFLNLGTMSIYSSVYMLPRSSSGTIDLTS